MHFECSLENVKPPYCNSYLSQMGFNHFEILYLPDNCLVLLYMYIMIRLRTKSTYREQK